MLLDTRGRCSYGVRYAILSPAKSVSLSRAHRTNFKNDNVEVIFLKHTERFSLTNNSQHEAAKQQIIIKQQHITLPFVVALEVLCKNGPVVLLNKLL